MWESDNSRGPGDTGAVAGLSAVTPDTIQVREGIGLRGHALSLYDENPFILKGRDGKERRLQSCASRTFLSPVMELTLNLQLSSWVVSFAPR